LAGRDPHRRLEPARRDVPRGQGRRRLAPRAGLWNGGDPGYGALQDFHLLGDRSLGQGRAGTRPRRAWRPDGADRLRDDGGRRSAAQARLGGADRGPGGTHAKGRRGVRATPGHVRVVRPRRRGRRDGSRNRARPEARARVYGIPRRRVRDRGPLHGRPGQAGRRRHRGDRRARPFRGGEDGARWVGRRGPRGRRRSRRITLRARPAFLVLLVLAVAAGVLWLVPSNEYVFLPDPPRNVEPLVHVPGEKDTAEQGGIYM